jgi:hypothetical protein
MFEAKMPFFVLIFPPNFDFDRHARDDDEWAALTPGIEIRGMSTNLRTAAAPNRDFMPPSESLEISES